jgi:peptidoglycan/xylan/chitin deacetylase (PgdA/CDA1 family)
MALILLASLLAFGSVTGGCASPPPTARDSFPAAVRFLLTFDDGPDARRSFNSTLRILQDLERNGVQPRVKAIFFVQTRSPDGGGTDHGRAVLQREHAEGHLIGLHSGTRRGHVSHISMSPEELDESLRDGVGDIRTITGQPPLLVRPPYWWFTPETLAQYRQAGLHMVLSDIKAYDGVDWGMHIFRRQNIRLQLSRLRDRPAVHALPVVAGRVPIVVTFHDTNDYTATHLEEYLRLLLEEARSLGLPVDEKPFYDDASAILAVALQRAVPAAGLDLSARLSVGPGR